jgi:uncharacterized SAM-binding protein YcdF (DUF218 family)
MFFTVSKLLSPALLPSHFVPALLMLGTALLFTRFKRSGRILTAVGALLLVAIGLLPAGALMLRPLEQRFAPSSQVPDTIVVLGGAIDPVRSEKLGRVALGGPAERLTDAAVLAHRYPSARLVVTGCNSALFREEPCEADWAKRFLVEIGVPADRILTERRSRDTFENAAYTQELLKPGPEARWLVVTSAFHMPRAVGIFRKLGIDVAPWPVAYLADQFTLGDVSGGFGRADTAVREWTGLVAYRLAGRTGELLPGP